MTEKEKTETDKLIKKIKRMAGKAMLASNIGQFDKGLKIIKQGEELIRNFQGNLPKELEDPHCWLIKTKGDIIANRGYLTRRLEIANELLTVAEKYGIKKHVAHGLHQIGFYYWRSGNLDEALMHYDRAIMENNIKNMDIDSRILKIKTHSDAMRVAIDKGDLELARKYFERLEVIYEQKPGDSILNYQYKCCKALILQTSMRSRDKAKAEELFNEVIEAKTAISYHKISALVGLCELLLVELRMTGEMDVISEIKPLLEKLIEIAQQWESDLYLMEAYIIQGKLALLTFDTKTARRVLIQAQRIAERRGFNGVAEEIASLHENLKGKLDEWERLKEINAPLSERIELARLDEHFKGQFRKKIMRMERVAEQEITVYKESQSCLVCKGSAGGFNIYVCPQCNSIYCKGCAKAVVEIENACWMCESPIDVTRPSKPFEQEEEEIIIEEKSDKKAPKGEPK